VIDEHRNKIPHLPCRAQSTGDGIEHAAFPLAGNGRIFQHPPQRIAFLEQRLDAAQFLQYARGIEQVAFGHRDIGESPGVCAHHGSHG
jgi:hypothetical protein